MVSARNMKMKMTALTLLTIFTFGISLHANGPLVMKGFHQDIKFDAACKLMSTFKNNSGDFISNKKEKKCGFGRNGSISYSQIIGQKDSNRVDMIIISSNDIDYLFEAKGLNGRKFSKVFLNKYNWIDSYKTYGTYTQESTKYNWKLSIDKKKWMKITFFNKNKNEGKK